MDAPFEVWICMFLSYLAAVILAAWAMMLKGKIKKANDEIDRLVEDRERIRAGMYMMNNIRIKVGNNKWLDLYQEKPNTNICILHVNDKNEFVGVAEAKPKDFAAHIDKLIPEDRKDIWR